MCEWFDCDKDTGSKAKKFCGLIKTKGSCNNKNKLHLNKKYQKDEFKTEYNNKDGTGYAKRARDVALSEQGYCMEAKNSGMF